MIKIKKMPILFPKDIKDNIKFGGYKSTKGKSRYWIKYMGKTYSDLTRANIRKLITDFEKSHVSTNLKFAHLDRNLYNYSRQGKLEQSDRAFNNLSTLIDNAISSSGLDYLELGDLAHNLKMRLERIRNANIPPEAHYEIFKMYGVSTEDNFWLNYEMAKSGYKIDETGAFEYEDANGVSRKRTLSNKEMYLQKSNALKKLDKMLSAYEQYIDTGYYD